ncbi:hypothetical protein E2320_000217, partial [Naja naja]
MEITRESVCCARLMLPLQSSPHQNPGHSSLKTSYQFQALNFCPVIPHRSSGPSSGPREVPTFWHRIALQMSEPRNETGAHLNLNRSDQNITNQTRADKPEKPLVDSKINSHKACGRFTEIPLLHLKARPPSKCSPSKFTTKDTDCRRSLGQTGLPLLYSNLPPLTKFQIPKLIPLQDLIAFEQSQHFGQYPQHKEHPKQMQLLKANIKLNETRQVRSYKKRQKRRIENRLKEKEEKMKAIVTNQQDDSSVLPDAESQAELSAGPCDTDSLLTSQPAKLSFTDFSMLQNNVLKSSQNIQTVSEELIDESVGNQSVTSASVTVEKSHQDVITDLKQVLAETNKNQPIISAPASSSETERLPSCIPQTLPPELYFNFKSDSATTETAEQRYISVTDIEAGDLFKNLPDFSSVYTGQLGQKISKQHFSGKLQEMDRQLSYLQNLAEKMEKEYSTTKL